MAGVVVVAGRTVLLAGVVVVAGRTVLLAGVVVVAGRTVLLGGIGLSAWQVQWGSYGRYHRGITIPGDNIALPVLTTGFLLSQSRSPYSPLLTWLTHKPPFWLL